MIGIANCFAVVGFGLLFNSYYLYCNPPKPPNKENSEGPYSGSVQAWRAATELDFSINHKGM